jgi:hypothetical protein
MNTEPAPHTPSNRQLKPTGNQPSDTVSNFIWIVEFLAVGCRFIHTTMARFLQLKIGGLFLVLVLVMLMIVIGEVDVVGSQQGAPRHFVCLFQ